MLCSVRRVAILPIFFGCGQIYSGVWIACNLVDSRADRSETGGIMGLHVGPYFYMHTICVSCMFILFFEMSCGWVVVSYIVLGVCLEQKNLVSFLFWIVQN